MVASSVVRCGLVAQPSSRFGTGPIIRSSLEVHRANLRSLCYAKRKSQQADGHCEMQVTAALQGQLADSEEVLYKKQQLQEKLFDAKCKAAIARIDVAVSRVEAETINNLLQAVASNKLMTVPV